MKAASLLTAALLALLVAACGDGGSTPVTPPFGDLDSTDAESAFDPGDYDNDGSCSGEGYGDGCTPVTGTLDCSQGPCVFGTCRDDGAGGYCVCDTGYTGTLCNTCADGYRVQGLACIANDACASMACVYGTCRVLNEQPFCVCETGYSGTLCDACADGYHENNLRCVAD